MADVLSVCTGVGGLDLGLERAGHRIIAQCEIDERCRAILAKHWPGVPCFDEMREVNHASVQLALDRAAKADRDGALRSRPLVRDAGPCVRSESAVDVGCAAAANDSAGTAGGATTQAWANAPGQAEGERALPHAGEEDHQGTGTSSMGAGSGVRVLCGSGSGHRPYASGGSRGSNDAGEPATAVRAMPHRQDAGRETKEGDLNGCFQGVDLLCGGTPLPCQDLSTAGRRAGLDGDRSGLFFEFARIADELVRPGGWLLFENVPGLLSSPGGARNGRDFAIVLATLADIGFHDIAWRVLDSRYFGVPQRRRRVYIVGRRAVGDRARAVLLEPESGGGDFAPSREARARVAASLASGSHGAGVSPPGRRQHDDETFTANGLVKRYGRGTDSDATDTLITGTVRSHMRPGSNDSGGIIAHSLTAEGLDASEDETGRGTPLTIAGPLGGGNDGAGRRSVDDPNLVCSPADAHGVRATPGLPGRLDDPKPDGPRYAQMGNAVTVNVAHWIGLRLMAEAE